jgi:hypothetical protein
MHFSSPEVQYIGPTSGCGCDFPHVILQNGEWLTFFLGFKEDVNKPTGVRFNREALVDLLRKTGEKAVGLYGIWGENFAEQQKARENISLVRILDSDFWFKEQNGSAGVLGAALGKEAARFLCLLLPSWPCASENLSGLLNIALRPEPNLYGSQGKQWRRFDGSRRNVTLERNERAAELFGSLTSRVFLFHVVPYIRLAARASSVAN